MKRPCNCGQCGGPCGNILDDDAQIGETYVDKNGRIQKRHGRIFVRQVYFIIKRRFVAFIEWWS